MSSYSYLCSSPLETIYPSFVQPGYDSDQQTIACDVECVPLLWLTLFRAGDLVTKEFTVDGGSLTVEAPLTTKAKALAAMRWARPSLVEAFRDRGSLDPFLDMLAAAITAAPHEHVSIELQEIAALYPSEHAFHTLLRETLTAIEASSPAQTERLVELSQLRPGRPFPPVRLLLDGLTGHDDDHWNL